LGAREALNFALGESVDWITRDDFQKNEAELPNIDAPDVAGAK